MELHRISINTATPGVPVGRVMIIYTGGTFGMVRGADGTLTPFDFNHILDHLPILRQLMLELTVVSFARPIDSSNMGPEQWVTIADVIAANSEQQDGFVVLHGTDTMSYTASAVAFMLDGLTFPVIFTGAQLPISEPRSDARENLVTSLEIASLRKGGKAVVPEVCIFFGNQLLRGCRSKKVESQQFDAFESENYPPLATAGVKIDFNNGAIRACGTEKLRLRTSYCPDVSVLKIFPGITPAVVRSVLEAPGLRGVILETFGSGNAPNAGWFLQLLEQALNKGIIIVNVSQCPGGMVQQGRYETSRELKRLGVIGGSDITTEAAVTKLMLALGNFSADEAARWMRVSLAGEFSE